MEKNNKLLIVKILIAVLIISALVVVFFLFTKEEKEVILSSEDVKVKDSMLQLTFVAEKFKEKYGYYSEEKVDVDFCELKDSDFAGVGNGHILCANLMNRIPGRISIKMNDNAESVSKYCIAKELSMGKFWCIDYSGYFDIASGCSDDYRCQ